MMAERASEFFQYFLCNITLKKKKGIWTEPEILWNMKWDVIQESLELMHNHSLPD